MNLRSLAARGALIAAVLVAVSFGARHAPREQTLAIRLGQEPVLRLEATLIQAGETEPAGGFSQDFPAGSPRVVRHTFSLPNGDYLLLVSLKTGAALGETRISGPEALSGDAGPIPSETSFERRVNLAGGEVLISPD